MINMLMLIILILKNQKFQVYIPSKNVNKKKPFQILHYMRSSHKTRAKWNRKTQQIS
jgi:hypothetical protein